MTLQPELITAALKMVAALAVIVCALWGGLYLIKRFARLPAGGPQGRAIKVLASSYVGMKKTVSLVEIPGRILVLGITPERITLLDRIAKTDLEALAEEGAGRKKTASFLDELHRHAGRPKDGP